MGVTAVSLQVIAAEGEQKASRALKEASEVIAESSSALQLRYLQVRTRKVAYSSLETDSRSSTLELVLFSPEIGAFLVKHWCFSRQKLVLFSPEIGAFLVKHWCFSRQKLVLFPSKIGALLIQRWCFRHQLQRFCWWPQSCHNVHYGGRGPSPQTGLLSKRNPLFAASRR